MHVRDVVVSVKSSNCIWRYKSTGEFAIFIALNVAGYIHTYIHTYTYTYTFWRGRSVCGSLLAGVDLPENSYKMFKYKLFEIYILKAIKNKDVLKLLKI